MWNAFHAYVETLFSILLCIVVTFFQYKYETHRQLKVYMAMNTHEIEQNKRKFETEIEWHDDPHCENQETILEQM